MSSRTKHLITAVILAAGFLSVSQVKADEYYSGGVTVDIDRVIEGYLWIDDATVNLLKGAHIKTSLFVGDVFSSSGSVLNIHGGQIDGTLSLITSYNGMAEAQVTVFGRDFAVGGVAVPAGTPEVFIQSSTLSGVYEDGTPFSFVVDCYQEGDFYQTVKLSWVVSQPVMAVTPESIDFGTAKTGISAAQTVTVTNNGNASLILESAAFADGSSSAFALTPSQLPITIAPSASVSLEVVFTPADAGTFQGVLRLAGNDVNNPVKEVALTGTGIKPVIAVNPLALDFGRLDLGKSAAATIAIANNGQADLVIQSIAFADGSNADFALATAPSMPLTVVPGAAVEIGLTYIPTAEGTAAAALRIASDDIAAALVEVALTGEAVNPVLTPLQQIDAIIVFYDNNVMAKTIYGVGNSRCAKAHVQAVRQMLMTTKCLIKVKYYRWALMALCEIDKLTDGSRRPQDIVAGPAVAELNAKIDALTKTLKTK